MIIKQNFDILRGIPNVFSLPRSKIDQVRISDISIDRAQSMLKLASSSIKHFTAPFVEILANQIKKKSSPVVFCFISEYPLYCTYNQTTKQALVNLSPFRVEEIVRIPLRNLYAVCIYALELKSSFEEQISKEVIGLVSSFFLSIFMKLFGKKYGLLAAYSSLVSDLKYILTVYTAVGLFGLKQDENLYKKAASASKLENYTKYDLSDYDFKSFRSVISSLNQLQIFPGFNEYEFVNQVNKLLNIQFLPMFEDLSRFLSTIVACDIPGNSVFPTFVKGLNRSVFMSLLVLSNRMLKMHKSKLII